jgi:TetR/AcrR family acrAB operon transcriptional repressor
MRAVGTEARPAGATAPKSLRLRGDTGRDGRAPSGVGPGGFHPGRVGPGGVAVESDAASPPQPPPRATPGVDRKAQTQARILEAAVALFGARGYDATSISAIASRAGLSRAAVFWHFSDKRTLFQEALRTMLGPFFEQLQSTLANTDPRLRLFELFDVYEQFVAVHRTTIQSIVRWVFESSELRTRLRDPLLVLVDEFVRDIRNSLEELVADRAQAAALAETLASALHGNLILSLLDGDPRRAAVRLAGVRQLTEHLLRSAAPEGSAPGPRRGARSGGPA